MRRRTDPNPTAGPRAAARRDRLRPRAGDLVTLEPPETLERLAPTAVLDRHHVLVNTRPAPHRVENWRDGRHHVHTIRRHDVTVAPAGRECGWRWRGRARCILVTLDPELLGRFAGRELGLILTDAQLIDEPQRNDPSLCAAAVQMRDALNPITQDTDVLFDAFARVFLVKLLRGYVDARAAMADPATDLGPDRFRRVLDHIAEKLARPIGVEDMAAVAGMSPSAFSRAFKAAIGDTPHQFLSRFRVERAQEMMLDCDRPLVDIALACGFADQPHLGRIFKKFTGETPKAWRDRMRDSEG